MKKQIDKDNYFIINKQIGVDSITGPKAHNLYFALLKAARKYYRTLDEQEKIVLYCIVRNLQEV